MKPRIPWKGFNPINYVIALYNPRNTPLIDPLSFMLGRWRAETYSSRKQLLKAWLEFDISVHDFEPVFERKPVLADVKEDEKWIRRYRVPSSLTIDELVHSIERWIKKDYHNYNLMREGGDEVFLDIKAAGTYGGEIWFNGKVRRRGVSFGRGKYEEIEIAGPFETSRFKLAAISSTDREYRENIKKLGYSIGHYISPDIAALLYYAKYNPSQINNLEQVEGRRVTDIWLPIHSKDPQYHDIAVKTIIQDKQPPLDHLTIDSVIQYLTRGRKTKFDLNKSLTRIPVIYDPLLIELIETGRAGFIPIAEKWIFNRSKDGVPEPQRWWYDSMRNFLVKSGYRFRGLVVEKKNSPYETIAIEYVHKLGKKSARLLFFDNLPPLLLMRKTDKRFKIKIFEQEKEPSDIEHPFAGIFFPKPTYDDRTRRYTSSEILLSPPGVKLPQEMWPDYRAAIREHFRGGISKFRRQTHYRKNNIPDNVLINDKLAYAITK